MKKIRAFVYVLRNSLTNFNYYAEIRKVKFWFSLKYLFTLLIFTSFISLLPLIIGLALLAPNLPAKIIGLKKTIQNAYPDNLTFTVKGGHLTTNAPQPYFYSIFVVDTSASPSDFYKYQSKADVLITGSDIVTSDNNVTPLSQLQGDFNLDRSSYLSSLKSLDPYYKYLQPAFWAFLFGLVIFGPILLASSTLFSTLIYLLFISLIFLIGTRLFRGQFKFKEIYKMAMHASTLPIIFFTILGTIGLFPSIPFGYSLVLVLFLGIILNHIWKNS